MSGKTILVRTLLAQGAGYMSDEYAVINPTGRVHPYARPLSVWKPTLRTTAAVVVPAMLRPHPWLLFEGRNPRARLRSHEKTKPSSARRVGQTLHRQAPAGRIDRPATDHSGGGP
jgi:hypothetical protein